MKMQARIIFLCGKYNLHIWRYSVKDGIDYRCCKICGIIAVHEYRPIYGKRWFAMVSRTKYGAKKHLKKLETQS